MSDSNQPFDLIGFGETMIRLSTPDHRRLEDTEQLEISIGGTESNLAVALARLGRHVAWLSALPDNPLGRRIAGTLRAHGVDTSLVLWRDGSRAGVYFLEPGRQPRPTRVIYDRAGSAVATLDPDMIDPAPVRRARALHLTGITPALSEGCADICLRLADTASEAGRPLIFDVNYRALLWPPEDAARGIQPFLDRATLLFCGAADAATLWGAGGDPGDVARGLLGRSGARVAVVTAGDTGVVAASRDGALVHQAASPVSVVDPVGAGDAFAAGFLHVWLDQPDDLATALRSGVALAGLKMTMPGDLAIVSPGELDEAIGALDRPSSDIVR